MWKFFGICNAKNSGPPFEAVKDFPGSPLTTGKKIPGSLLMRGQKKGGPLKVSGPPTPDVNYGRSLSMILRELEKGKNGVEHNPKSFRVET